MDRQYTLEPTDENMKQINAAIERELELLVSSQNRTLLRQLYDEIQTSHIGALCYNERLVALLKLIWSKRNYKTKHGEVPYKNYAEVCGIWQRRFCYGTGRCKRRN